MDGTQKLPQRIFAPAVDALNENQALDSFALATAAWMQYCYVGINGHSVKNIASYPLRDPRETEIADALNGVELSADEIQKRLNGLSDFVPVELLNSDEWQRLVALNLRHLLADELALIAEHARS
jgi:fructuronate reductase